MYRVIAVDDEQLSIKRFEHIIQNENRISLIGSFTSPEDSLAFVKENTVDIAFLDIEMPGITGLELAEKILEIDPYISIIFVTAFDQYALEAFKAHAIGYLLKPLDISELSAQLDILEKSKQPREISATGNDSSQSNDVRLMVKCIGQFSCYVSGHESEPISFRTTKTAELFALLIHHYAAPMSKFSILDELFPDVDYEKSNKLFYVSCSYLRSAFAKFNLTDVMIRENDSYRLNTTIISCDYISLMDTEKSLASASLETLERAASYCGGEYLAGKSYEWALETKAYIETLSRRILLSLSDAYIKAGKPLESIQVLEKYLIMDPCNEDIVESLMKLYINNGQGAKARAVFQTFKQKLDDQFGLDPSDQLVRLLKKIN